MIRKPLYGAVVMGSISKIVVMILMKILDKVFLKKNNGEFFLLEEKYKEVNGSEWMYTTPTVTPLTEEEARKWGEEHLSVPLYEAAFGKVEE